MLLCASRKYRINLKKLTYINNIQLTYINNKELMVSRSICASLVCRKQSFYINLVALFDRVNDRMTAFWGTIDKVTFPLKAKCKAFYIKKLKCVCGVVVI